MPAIFESSGNMGTSSLQFNKMLIKITKENSPRILRIYFKREIELKIEIKIKLYK